MGQKVAFMFKLFHRAPLHQSLSSFYGDRVPRQHPWGPHVVLVTIIPLAQTPRPFQFLSAQSPEYVTLFRFCSV